nr:hypothetical protein [Tanacetum cinerariifolium]
MTIDQQVALDEALVPHARRIRIGKSNFRLRSDITSKESTLQVVYDVLGLTPIYKAFLVTSDVPEIYMQEFCATATTFDELPFKEEILAFLRYLGHSGEIKKITDEDFVYQVEHKDAKKRNEMYYLRFTKVIINFFMTKDPSIPRRNKVNWHYVIDDQMFTTIKLFSRHQNSQKFGAMLPIESTNEDIKNSATYKEYYAIASGATPPKTKASVRKTQSNYDTTMTPPTAAGTRLSTSTKVKQPAKSSRAKDDNDDDQDSDNDSDDFVHLNLSTHDKEAKDEESFDPIVQTPSHVENYNDESHGMNVGGDEGPKAEDYDKELYGDVNINMEGIDSFFESTHRVDVPVMTTIEPLLLSAPTLPLPSIPIISQVQQALAPSPTTAPSTSLQDLLNFGSLFGFDHRLKKLEANFSKYMQTNQLLKASLLFSIIKEQVKVQVFKILPKIEKIVNEQLKAEVLTRASNSSKTSYAVAAKLPELELKKIIIENMESNKSIYRSDEQRNLYKALVDSYECDKIILDTYGDMVMLKRCYDDEDKGEEPSAGSDRGSKRRRAGSKDHQTIVSGSAPAEEPMQTTQDLEEPPHQEFEIGVADDQPVAEASQHPEWESAQDVYSKRRIIAVIELQIIKWHNYKHLDWITVSRDDNKIYKFKDGDLKRLHIKDIEDMLLILVQGKLTNLTIEERFAFNVSLRMFTRSIVIQQRVEDLQLSVKSYQKKLNLINPDTYRSDLKCKEAYTAYSNPRGFIYPNKDK